VDDFSKHPRLRARHGESATVAPVAINAGGEVTLRLESNALGRLRGKVADADGKPMAGVNLVLYEWVRDGGSGSEAGVTAKDGTFEIRNVWPEATISVETNAAGWTRETSKRFALKPGETREFPPFALKPATLEVAGRVVDEKGAPLPGLKVHLHAMRSPSQDTSTDHDGRFRFAGVAAETVTLFTRDEGGTSVTATCEAGKTDIEIVAKPTPPSEAKPPAGNANLNPAVLLESLPLTPSRCFT